MCCFALLIIELSPTSTHRCQHLRLMEPVINVDKKGFDWPVKIALFTVDFIGLRFRFFFSPFLFFSFSFFLFPFVHSAQILIPSIVLVSFVPADHEARIAMRGFLPGSSEEQLQLSMLPPPPPRTHEQNVADGKISKRLPWHRQTRNTLPRRMAARTRISFLSFFLIGTGGWPC